MLLFFIPISKFNGKFPFYGLKMEEGALNTECSEETGKSLRKSILRLKTYASNDNSKDENINSKLHQCKKVTFADKNRKPLCQVFRIPSLLKKERLIKLKKKSCECLIL